MDFKRKNKEVLETLIVIVLLQAITVCWFVFCEIHEVKSVKDILK